MAGESPLSMMRTDRPRRASPAAGSRRRLWFIAGPIAAIAVLAGAWCALWYYAAAAADRTLAGWFEREAAAGRIYSCGSRTISGFPFGIRINCGKPAATIKSAQPPFAVNASDVTFAAQVYRPTYLVGNVAGPLTVSLAGQPPSLIATWELARMSVTGLPGTPDAFSFAMERPRIDRGGASSATALLAENAEFNARIIGGSAADRPVIEATLHFVSATAPTVHPLLAAPLQGDIDVIVSGLKDMSAKPLAADFREIQESGGSIAIKSLRLQRSDAIVLGSGSLTVNAQGRLDGDINVAIYGLENIIPQLGIDRLINQGIDRLAGQNRQSGLDRLLPGLSGIVSAGANASLVDNLKKMGQPTQIDQKPAVALPLRFSSGTVYLGMIRLGDIPPLF